MMTNLSVENNDRISHEIENLDDRALGLNNDFT